MRNLSVLLTKLSELSFHNIACINDKSVEVALHDGVEKLEKNIILEYFGLEPCLTTRLINVFKPLSKEEMNSLILLARITSCVLNAKIYFLINDSTNDIFEIAGLVASLIEGYGIEISDLIDMDFESIYLYIKDLKKSLERYRGSLASTNEDFERKSLALQEISRVLMNMLMRWSVQRHVIEALVKLIGSEFSLKPVLSANEVVERFRSERLRELKDILEGKDIGFHVVNLSSIAFVKPLSFRDALNLYDLYLKRQGCRDIFIVDGEEYRVIVKLSNLTWRVIVSP